MCSPCRSRRSSARERSRTAAVSNRVRSSERRSHSACAAVTKSKSSRAWMTVTRLCWHGGTLSSRDKRSKSLRPRNDFGVRLLGIGLVVATILVSGVLAMLYVTGTTINIQSLMGTLMTALVLVASMLPLSFHFAPGGEAMIPLARALIGGMLVSTLLTLFLVPCVYTLVKRDQIQATTG